MIELDEKAIAGFQEKLAEDEAAAATVAKYTAAIRRLSAFCGGTLRDKGQLVAFKQALAASGMAPGTVNGVLTAVNKLLDIYGYNEWRLRFLKVQRKVFMAPEREMTRAEYEKLVNTAKRQGDERLALAVQTLGATGARVSELASVTVEAVAAGKAEIRSKGKIRLLLLPKKLCKLLSSYCAKRGITAGPVFVTAGGKPIDRSNLWKSMKRLARLARVLLDKVFPHNLRHLFARTYYKKTRDIVQLADILGHSSVETTRIYTARSPMEQRRQMDALALLL